MNIFASPTNIILGSKILVYWTHKVYTSPLYPGANIVTNGSANIIPTIDRAKQINTTIFIIEFKKDIALSSESSFASLLYSGIKLVARAEPITANRTVGILLAVAYTAA